MAASDSRLQHTWPTNSAIAAHRHEGRGSEVGSGAGGGARVTQYMRRGRAPSCSTLCLCPGSVRVTIVLETNVSIS
eukprot:CAMPEP_0182908820 /NCGR_PEP_ID=MMETSP0034_2-20130328/35414_1 /TAXON_ID=156128 /ORGANISM="Nephroselmis pyriformis, Strain CCMP717" /LENGTH=75 /DNA_ID=CAMNT_0025045019 /DNA_START=31 /DNA_END=255 /DNA_ORIENTATION=-